MRASSLTLLLLLAIAFATALLAQVREEEQQSLPIGLTEEERTRLHEIGMNHRATSPPNGDVRSIAEWEPSQGVIIRWPLGISVAIIAEMSEDLMVTTIVGSTSQQASAISSYTAGGVNMANTNFIIAGTNSYWTRDYGPWFIFDTDGDLAIVDHIYNRPRPLDDVIPQVIGAQWGLSVYGLSLIHTGGNHMSDGLGMSMSERLVYAENPGLTQTQVDSLMFAYLGNDYTVLDYVESGGIHHIDCWAKFLNPTTILVKDVPPSDPSYSLLNDRAAFLSQQVSEWGRPYTIVRVYCPAGTAYTNSIILGRKVLMPTFSNPSADAAALQVYRDAMPGYEVLGFTGSWLDDDAIHCRAMGVPDSNMLFVQHVPLFDVGDSLNDYLVGVRIIDHSDAGLITDSLKIFYRTGAGPYLSSSLSSTANPDSFYGYIPAQSPGTEISYFIRAADNSGKVETHPYIGESWAHKFRVNIPPSIASADSFLCRSGDEFRYYPTVVDPDDSAHQLSYSNLPPWLNVQNDSLIGTPPGGNYTANFTVTVSDPYWSVDHTAAIYVYLCGDVNGNGLVNISDVVFIIAYIFNGGPAPIPPESGDVNCNGLTNISDVVTIIGYIFSGGAVPCASCP